MVNKGSVRRLAFLSSAVISTAFVATGVLMGANKPAWLFLATNVSIVMTLSLLWLEAKAFSFDEVLPSQLGNASEHSSPNLAHLASEDIRVFSSLDDGSRHGWTFENEVGRLGSTPLFLWATFQGKKWKYDGLTSESREAVVPEDVRLFGQLRYSVCAPATEMLSAKNVSVDKSTENSHGLHPALNRMP